MFKTIFSSLIFILLASFAFPQEKSGLSVFYSPLNCSVDVKEGMISDSGHTGKGGNLFEIRYSGSINSYFAVETGVQYSVNKIETDYFPEGVTYYMQSEVKMISVPVYGNLTFLKYFFAEAGPTFDFEVNHKQGAPVQNQSGVGLAFGVGAKYTFKNVSVFVNPFAQRHLLISFNSDETYERLWRSGIKFGVGCSF